MIRIASRCILILAVGLSLAGCDKCGDWFGIGKTQSCRTTPAQR